MPLYESVGPAIGLNGYDKLFQQAVGFCDGMKAQLQTLYPIKLNEYFGGIII
jgi:hypothetical protein